MKIPHALMSLWRDQHSPVEAEDVALLEAIVGSPVPTEYAELLMIRNGGHFYEPVVGEIQFQMWVRFIFYLDRRSRHAFNNVFSVIEDVRNELPDKWVPVGASDGDLILCDFSTGAVSKWIESEQEFEDDVWYSSISAWLGDLRFREFGPSAESDSVFDLIARGDIDRIRAQIGSGIDTDHCARGISLMHCAVTYLRYDIVALFIEHDVDVNCTDFKGEMPLDYALVKHAQDIVDLLVLNGARSGRSIW